MSQRLLLISSSRTHGTSFLEHCREAIVDRLSGIERVLFVPYAIADHDGYATMASQALQPAGIALDSIHSTADPIDAVKNAGAIFIGGGNSFRLLKTLYDHELLQPIREAVSRGTVYMGSSAGTNMACPTIRTSNDMPIVQPPSFDALALIPFQINPHFIDADPHSTHQGETREQRLTEYLEENETLVVGLREGSWLKVDGDQCALGGDKSAICLQRNFPVCEIPAESTFRVSNGKLEL